MDKDELVYFWQPFMGEAELVVMDTNGNVVDIVEPKYHMTKDGTGKIALLLPPSVKLTSNKAEPVVKGPGEDIFTVWVDGACSGNPGPGGWAYVIESIKIPNPVKHAAREEQTTNQRMELTAALYALQRCKYLSTQLYGLKARPVVKIHSDSQYVVNTMNGNYKNKANIGLISVLKTVHKDMDVTWVQVPRNSSEPMVLCDAMAKEASKTEGFQWKEGI